MCKKWKFRKDAKAYLRERGAQGEGSWVTWPLHCLPGDTFSPPHTVTRASTGSSWEAAAMEGRCGRGSGWLPTPEVGVRAHGDRFCKFQAPLPCLPAWALLTNVPAHGSGISQGCFLSTKLVYCFSSSTPPWIKNMDFRVWNPAFPPYVPLWTNYLISLHLCCAVNFKIRDNNASVLGLVWGSMMGDVCRLYFLCVRVGLGACHALYN